MAVSKRLRYEILRRDNHTCRYCGATAPDAPLRIDHVTPVALGGGDTPDNLVTACQDCNSGKSSATVDSTLVADVSQDALRWASAMQQAAARLLEQEEPKLEYRDIFLAEWSRWGIGEGEARKTLPLPGEWKTSIERFRVAGLPAWVWAEIVDTAMGYGTVKPENKFKYCCGIAWRKVQALQEEARTLLGEAPQAAPVDDCDDPEALVIEAAHLIWGQEWAMHSKGPTPAEVSAFLASARNAINAGVAMYELIEAAPYGAWFATADATEAVEHLRQNKAFVKQSIAPYVFNHAWYLTHGETAPQEIATKVWDDCDKLYEVGVHEVHVILAAAVAGLHGTSQMHAGLGPDGTNAIGTRTGFVHAENKWADAWCSASRTLSFPDERERALFRTSLEQVRSARQHGWLDIYTAATWAGAYQDTRLDSHLPSRGSALESAGTALTGGAN